MHIWLKAQKTTMNKYIHLILQPGGAGCAAVCNHEDYFHFWKQQGGDIGTSWLLRSCGLYSWLNRSLQCTITSTTQLYCEPFPLLWSPTHICLTWVQPPSFLFLAQPHTQSCYSCTTIICLSVDGKIDQERSHMSAGNCTLHRKFCSFLAAESDQIDASVLYEHCFHASVTLTRRLQSTHRIKVLLTGS